MSSHNRPKTCFPVCWGLEASRAYQVEKVVRVEEELKAPREIESARFEAIQERSPEIFPNIN
jgi:hypothetical protein